MNNENTGLSKVNQPDFTNDKFDLTEKNYVSVGENLFIQAKSHDRNIPVPKNYNNNISFDQDEKEQLHNAFFG